MTTTPSYPASIVAFGPDKINSVDIVQAADPNTLRAEVLAIETVIGASPSVSTAASSSSSWYNDGRDYSTIINRLANIEIGIVADTHTQYAKNAGGSTITPGTISTVGLTIKAKSGQTANLQQWEDSSGNIVTYIDSTGKLYASGASVAGGGSGDLSGNFLLGGM